MLTDKANNIPIADIWIDRDSRQRRDVSNVEDLVASIKAVGRIINPITVEKKAGPSGQPYKLVAGERRLTACIKLGHEKIFARFAHELTLNQSRLLELEENVRRSELILSDKANAFLNMWKIYETDNPGATREAFASYIGYSVSTVSEYIRIAEESAKPNSSVAAAKTIGKARAVMQKNRKADIARVMNDLILAPEHDAKPEESNPLKKTYVENLSFLDHLPSRKFSLIHCDFPYGINFDNSPQAKGSGLELYKDTPETYWTLCERLRSTISQIALPHAHVMFWFSMKYYHETLLFFRESPIKFNPTPLIWHKTDKGMMPDFRRLPQFSYEVCFFGSIGDPYIFKPVSNVYACPAQKDFHISEKAVPMLAHFMSMMVNNESSVFDPTAGSGNALRAALRLGANTAYGFEIDPTIAEAAQKGVVHTAGMAQLSLKVSSK